MNIRELVARSAAKNRGGFIFIEKIFRRVENFFLPLFGIEIIDVFGDSHSSIFFELNGTIPKLRFRCISVSGATVFGLGNPNSKTNALEIYKMILPTTGKKKRTIFLLGEVDVGFLIWIKAQKEQQDSNVFLTRVLNRYFQFLEEVVLPLSENLYLTSIPLPTIKDGEEMGEVANLRKQIVASQRERTEMTLRFNRALNQWCSEQGCGFLSLDEISLDLSTGLVKNELLNSNPKDHHYDKVAYTRILRKCIINNF